jgi:hypothetical protein
VEGSDLCHKNLEFTLRGSDKYSEALLKERLRWHPDRSSQRPEAKGDAEKVSIDPSVVGLKYSFMTSYIFWALSKRS